MTEPNIAYVVKRYPRLSETFIVNEILEMERKGAHVTIFALKTPDEGRFHEKLSRVQADVVYLPPATPAACIDLIRANLEEFSPVREALGRLFWDALNRDNSAALREFGSALFLALEIRKRGVDHIHAHFGTAPSTVAGLASRISGIPYSFTAHAKDIYHESTDVEQLRVKIDDAAFVVTVCDENRRFLEENFPSSTPIHRIYNGLDLDEFQFHAPGQNGSLQILGVGRLVPKKGFDTLIRSCAILRERGVEYSCRIIGGGLESENLAGLVDELGLGDLVRLDGPRTDREVKRAMKDADLFILPARIADDGNKDALPTVLLEALATGLPSISTDVTGIPEIIGDGAGELVPANDPDEIANRVELLTGSRERLEEIARAGRHRAEDRFDIRKNLVKLYQLFCDSAGRGNRFSRSFAGTGEIHGEADYAPRLS